MGSLQCVQNIRLLMLWAAVNTVDIIDFICTFNGIWSVQLSGKMA